MSPGEFRNSYLPLKDALFRVAFYILESVPDAEDAVQDLYLKLWDAGPALETVRNPKAYCVTLMRNMCLDRLRRADRRKTDGMPETEAGEAPADERLDGRERIKRVCRIMEDLPERERMVLRMKVFEDRSYGEIQQSTGIGYLSLRVLLSNARRKIKKVLD